MPAENSSNISPEEVVSAFGDDTGLPRKELAKRLGVSIPKLTKAFEGWVCAGPRIAGRPVKARQIHHAGKWPMGYKRSWFQGPPENYNKIYCLPAKPPEEHRQPPTLGDDGEDVEPCPDAAPADPTEPEETAHTETVDAVPAPKIEEPKQPPVTEYPLPRPREELVPMWSHQRCLRCGNRRTCAMAYNKQGLCPVGSGYVEP